MFDINRRGFLGSLIAGGTGLILPNTAQALVFGDRYVRLVSVISTLKSKTETFYAIAGGDKGLALSSEAPARSRFPAKADVLSHAVYSSVRIMALADASYVQAFENYFDTLFTDFATMPISLNEASQKIADILMGTLSIDMLSDADLRQYEDYIVSIAAVRYLMTDIKAPLVREGKSREYIHRYTDTYHHLIVR